MWCESLTGHINDLFHAHNIEAEAEDWYTSVLTDFLADGLNNLGNSAWHIVGQELASLTTGSKVVAFKLFFHRCELLQSWFFSSATLSRFLNNMDNIYDEHAPRGPVEINNSFRDWLRDLNIVPV